VFLLACVVTLPPRLAGAEPLDQLLPNLFGGQLLTSVNIRDPGNDVQPVQITGRFNQLSSALAVARGQAPIPSASGSFRFRWDPDIDTFVRSEQSLGPVLAERAQTLGRGSGTLSVSYTHADFDTLEGDALDDLGAVQPAFSQEYLASFPPGDVARVQNDMLRTTLDFSLSFDQFFLVGAYGLTDTIDLSMALSIARVHMRANAVSEIVSCPPGQPCGDDPGGGYFALNQVGLVHAGAGPVCSQPNHCAQDGFDESAWGTGDLYYRAKWNFADTRYADLAVAGVLTLPTGNADDFLGFHDPTFTPWLIASKSFGRLAPHVNLGYSFRSSEDVSQAQWIAGADFIAFRWLTLASDFLGYHDDDRDGINDDVYQSAVGFKVNPWGHLVLAGNFQFPLNNDGLRADVIYTGQVEWTF
jgi:hypothetical protein